MEWPTGLLAVVVVLAVSAAVGPWLAPRGRAGLWLVPFPAFTAALCWWIYEQRLREIYPPGDPLIRVDLLVIRPLMAIAAASTLAALVARARRGLRGGE